MKEKPETEKDALVKRYPARWKQTAALAAVVAVVQACLTISGRGIEGFILWIGDLLRDLLAAFHISDLAVAKTLPALMGGGSVRLCLIGELRIKLMKQNGLGHNVNETVFALGKPQRSYFTGVNVITGILRVVFLRYSSNPGIISTIFSYRWERSGSSVTAARA